MKYKGDGLKLYEAVQKYGKTYLLEALDIKEGTLQNWYSWEVLGNEHKILIAEAFHKTVEDIFGESPDN